MASTSSSSEMSLRKFNGLNFNFWKEQMQDYIYSQGSNRNRKCFRRIQAERMQNLDRIVRATIWMHLSELVYFTVQSCSTAFQLWKTLLDTYEKKVAATKIYLIQHLYNLRMKESNSIQAYLNKYESLISHISIQETTIED